MQNLGGTSNEYYGIFDIGYLKKNKRKFLTRNVIPWSIELNQHEAFAVNSICKVVFCESDNSLWWWFPVWIRLFFHVVDNTYEHMRGRCVKIV